MRGEIIKGLSSGKINPETGVLASETIPGDENCGYAEEDLGEGVFISCFELTIGTPQEELYTYPLKDKLSPGDTTLIETRFITEEGDTVEFEDNQLFYVSLSTDLTPSPFGTLLNPNGVDTTDNLVEVGKGFSFIASPRAPDTTVNVYVAIDQGESFLIDTLQIKIKSESNTILLGESKFFYAINDPEDLNSMQIKEFKLSSEPSSLPDGGIASAFTSEDIIEIVKGDKSGVYLERKRAEISSSGAITMHDLPAGMIRVIGRYWEADKEYKVKLKASTTHRTGEIAIEVIRPDKLGDQYAKAKDVFDTIINVDSLIIANAGKFGIPPQIIKAHISKEAAITSFGGFSGFSPTYVYEPFRTEFDLRDFEFNLNKEWDESDFKVSQNNMGNGESVPNHQYVENFNYPQNPKKIWDMVSTYSKIESDTPPGGAFPQYANRDPNTQKITFYGLYDEPLRLYESIIAKFKQDKVNQDSLYIFSNDSLVTFMKTKWKGGLDNVYAQTRMASSYGYLQILYPTAVLDGGRVGAGYSRTELPEKINEVEQSIELAMTLYEKYLGVKDLYMWDKTYEGEWIENVIRRWNQTSSYRKEVSKVIQNFKPKKS